MKFKLNFVLISIFIFIALLFMSNFALADMGPKPTAKIEVYYNGNNISDTYFNAKMLTCLDIKIKPPSIEGIIPQLNILEADTENNCFWRPTFFAWAEDCKNSQCQFGYMLPDSFKLAIYIPSLNKTFITNEISRPNFNSNYKVDLSLDGTAIITDTTPVLKTDKIIGFIEALILTLIIELLVALLYLSITKLSKRILISVLIANVISLPLVWFTFPLIKNIILVFVLSEIFAFIFEAYFIYFFNKKEITLRKSFLLSIIINVASVVIGFFILFILDIFRMFI